MVSGAKYGIFFQTRKLLRQKVGYCSPDNVGEETVLAMQPFAGGCSDGCHGGQPEGLSFFHFWKAIKMKQYVDLYTPYGDSSSYGEGTKKVPLPVAFHLM